MLPTPTLAPRPRMLVIDDERVITFALAAYFRQQNFDVDCAAECDEALALISHRDYDVVVADLRLTGTDDSEGLQVIEFARARSATTGIILLTAYGTPDTEADARRMGADAVLQKPKPLPFIAETIAAVIGQHT